MTMPAILRTSNAVDVAPERPAPACADRHLGPCCGSYLRGARVGVDAILCKSHYSRRYKSLHRAAAKLAGPGPVEPCAACGTTAGHVRPGDRRPMRFARRAEGRSVLLCGECHHATRRAASAGAPVALAVGDLEGLDDDDATRYGPPPGPVAIRLHAMSILTAAAEKGDELEDRRLTRMERGPRWRMSPAEGAARAIAEYGNTIFGGGNRRENPFVSRDFR